MLLLAIGYWLLANCVFASNIDELKAKIEERNSQITEIQKEIDRYQEELNKNTKEAATLKEQIRILEVRKKKFISDITLTQKQVESTGFDIERLDIEIQRKEEDISGKFAAIG